MHDPYCVITKHITEMRDEKSNIVILYLYYYYWTRYS